MTDPEFVDFLQRVLPRLSLRWRGFRRVRRIVRKRLARRIRELMLEDLGAYERYLDAHPEERVRLDAMCWITVTRFGRDRSLWQHLGDAILPWLARTAHASGRTELRAWSAACASGEEPFTLSLLWDLARPAACDGLQLEILASDVDAQLLARARRAQYPRGSERELPARWVEQAFESAGGELRLHARHRARVRFAEHDIRRTMPDGPFDLILARNLPFTYFDEALQRRVLAGLHARLRREGALIVGAHEQLPEAGSFEQAPGMPCVWWRRVTK